MKALHQQRSLDNTDFHLKLANHFVTASTPYLKNPVLDAGCGVGVITQKLAALGYMVHGVDGNPNKIRQAKQNIPPAKFSCCHIQEYTANHKYGTIILKNILEHLTPQDATTLLTKCKTWLQPNSNIIIYVPSKTSLHKRVGYHMGLNKQQGELTRLDYEVGHQQTYDRQTLHQQLATAGYKIIYERGLIIKPFSNIMMKQQDTAYVDALYKLAEDSELTDLASGIFTVATPLQEEI